MNPCYAAITWVDHNFGLAMKKVAELGVELRLLAHRLRREAAAAAPKAKAAAAAAPAHALVVLLAGGLRRLLRVDEREA